MASVQCPSCGREISDRDKVCMYCGFRLRKYCPKCGTELSLSAMFCSKCGASVAAKEEERRPLQMPDTIAVMGPQQTAQRGLTGRAVPGQQVSQQASGYERQARLAQETIERQPARQQMQQASDYQQQMQNAQEAAGRQQTQQQLQQQANDYQRQMQSVQEAADRQQLQQQANDYQQQAKNAQEAIDQPRQQLNRQAADYEHQTEMAKQAMEQTSGQNVSHSATVGARRAAKLGGETVKVAAKHVSRSAGNMLALKIVAIAASIIIVAGATIGGGILIHRLVNTRKPLQTDTVFVEPEETEQTEETGETGETDIEAPAMIVEVDPDSLEQEAIVFLNQFSAFYNTESRRGSREFDAEKPDSGILKSIVVSWKAPCIDLNIYPGAGRNIIDGQDPNNWWTEEDIYGERRYAAYDALEVDWIMKHIFHVPEDRIAELREEVEAERVIYRESNARGEYYYADFTGEPENVPTDEEYYSVIEIESLKTDGEKYYVTYRQWYRYAEEYYYTELGDEYYGDFNAVIAKETIDGADYWTMYANTADVPYESEPASDLFSMISREWVGDGDSILNIEQDGSFTYQHFDSAAGCHGQFVNPRRINAYTYAIDVGTVYYDGTGSTDIQGLDQGEVFYVYLPEKPQAELPFLLNQQLRWIFGQYSYGAEKLGFTLICNEDPFVAFAEYRTPVMGY
ncbi:MAG: zinc-ribbon domain-containing protein [Clostridia bacterium]|nr:zinc-ribbon domain-containing protein [Clostridia bacterium]